MGQAYTPGLKILERTRWTVTRMLPVPGDVLVREGDVVTARTVVARTQQPGDAVPVAVARQLGVSALSLAHLMQVREGDKVREGNVLAATSGLWGWFAKSCVSPSAGVVEAVSRVTGQIILRSAPREVELLAYLPGRVVEVTPQLGVLITAEISVVQGIFGVGGEAYGRLIPVCARPSEDLTPEQILPEHRGGVLIGGRLLSVETIRRARECGVSAIVSGGMDDQDLRELLGYDLGVAITGNEHLGLTIILTEGFGAIAMANRTFELLRSHAGHEASLSGATQIRAGVLRPEILIAGELAGRVLQTTLREPILATGSAVRVVRDPDFGVLGTVAGLPPEPRLLASESRARVAEVLLSDGRTVFIPRANLELVET